MRAIDYAWLINLQLPKDMQYKDKENLICEKCIFDDEYKIHINKMHDEDVCVHFNEDCNKCWNAEIDNKIHYKSYEIAIKQSDNERIQQYFDEFINNQALGLGSKYTEGAYMFLQFILKHE